MMVLLCASSCVTQRVQDRTLLPAISAAWEGVRADAELGGMPEVALAAWDSAVEAGFFTGMDTSVLLNAAHVGIEQRLLAGEIGPNGVIIMRNRAISFVHAVDEYRRIVVAPVRSRRLVISRSSWATYPPAALASRTYR